MVSSLWIVADCAGGYAGSTLGILLKTKLFNQLIIHLSSLNYRYKIMIIRLRKLEEQKNHFYPNRIFSEGERTFLHLLHKLSLVRIFIRIFKSLFLSFNFLVLEQIILLLF